jgi:hypothetical protein
MRWKVHVERKREMRNVHTILIGKPERKRPGERHRRRWEHNIKMDLKEVGREDVVWIQLARDSVQWCAVVNTAMNL